MMESEIERESGGEGVGERGKEKSYQEVRKKRDKGMRKTGVKECVREGSKRVRVRGGREG